MRCECFAWLSTKWVCVGTVKQTRKTFYNVTPSDHLHEPQLAMLTAWMLKEGCQLQCGVGRQVSWVWRSNWLQAGACAVLSHPALPTQQSFHFAAQQQNGYCILLTTSQAHVAHQPCIDLS